MKINRNQHQNGYVTVVILALIIGTIIVMTFVLEIGRLIAKDATAENAVDLSVKAGVYAFGDTFEKEMKKAHDKAEIEVQEELDAAGTTLTEEEFKEEVKKKLKEYIPEVKQKAVNDCKNKSRNILEANDATVISISCSENEVKVTGKSRYQSVFKETQLGSGDIERTRTQKIQIHIE